MVLRSPTTHHPTHSAPPVKQRHARRLTNATLSSTDESHPIVRIEPFGGRTERAAAHGGVESRMTLADGSIWCRDRRIDECSFLVVVPGVDSPTRLSHKEAAAVLLRSSEPEHVEPGGLDVLADDAEARALCSDAAWGSEFVAYDPADEKTAMAMLDGADLSEDPIADRLRTFPTSPLADVQETLGSVYGKLEIDSALAWALEELGELAQASRRGESPQRLAEELGQCTAWMFCLGNILDVDVATAMQSALRSEVWRQYSKYGALNPAGSS